MHVRNAANGILADRRSQRRNDSRNFRGGRLASSPVKSPTRISAPLRSNRSCSPSGSATMSSRDQASRSAAHPNWPERGMSEEYGQADWSTTSRQQRTRAVSRASPKRSSRYPSQPRRPRGPQPSVEMSRFAGGRGWRYADLTECDSRYLHPLAVGGVGLDLSREGNGRFSCWHFGRSFERSATPVRTLAGSRFW